VLENGELSDFLNTNHKSVKNKQHSLCERYKINNENNKVKKRKKENRKRKKEKKNMPRLLRQIKKRSDRVRALVRARAGAPSSPLPSRPGRCRGHVTRC